MDYEEENDKINFHFECLDYQENPNEALLEIYKWKSGSKPSTSSVTNVTRTKTFKTAQGFQTDQEKKDAVELRAMRVDENYYKNLGYKVTDVSSERGLGYDLTCESDSLKFGVEVKGASSSIDKVIVTRKEVEAAQKDDLRVDLFVVDEIEFEKKENKTIGVRGNQPYIEENWKASNEALSFNYSLKNK